VVILQRAIVTGTILQRLSEKLENVARELAPAQYASSSGRIPALLWTFVVSLALVNVTDGNTPVRRLASPDLPTHAVVSED